MKICPKCGSNKVITFDTDNDLCKKCDSRFPAVEEIKCVAGCRAYEGGEIRHHKDCYFYPESFSKMYDKLEARFNIELITALADDVWAMADWQHFPSQSRKLKTISACLHDLRANRDTGWYLKLKKEKKQPGFEQQHPGSYRDDDGGHLPNGE